ncbi:MAG: hypothetical protein WCK02_16480 [Bacteroidota bacterium]
MRKIYFAILIIGIFTSCNNNKGPKQEDYDKLQAELTDCKKTVEELSNTPQMRLTNGQKFQSQNDLVTAKKEYNELIQKFPGSTEAKKANEFIIEIEKIDKEKILAEERKKTLGFKAIPESSLVKIGGVNIKFNSVNTGSQWVFDNYGSEWKYRSAERGEIYVLSKVSISADSKNPSLPPISIYKMLNGSLTLIGTMGYEFSRWKDYGTYLGNNADFGNDFAHTKTISFSCGLSISKTDIDDEAVFVVVKKTNCFYRSEDRFGSPPVSYSEGECGIKSNLTIDDFDKDYVLVKVFNKNKL